MNAYIVSAILRAKKPNQMLAYSSLASFAQNVTLKSVAMISLYMTIGYKYLYL